MAPHLALINPIPLLGGVSNTLELAVLGCVGMALLGGAAHLGRRWHRRLAIAELGKQRGLGEQTSIFLGQLFAGEGLDAAETMMTAPDLLRARLARELRRRHRDESAQAYAERAALLLEELNSIPPPFPGAPAPFQQLALQDAADPNSKIVTAWVLSVDERNITIISRHDCDWPMRRELLATPPAGHGETFRAALLLRPVPPRHEWVLTHDLVDVITNRRAAVRVPCCLHTHVLPDSGDTVLLRERLADQETVHADDLRRLHGWAQRHAATVLDVSSDGCRVELEHEVALRDRFHVMIAAPDDRLAGLPLAEVVSLQRAGAGRVTAGVRFIGMRLKERTRLAEFVRALAAREGGAVASAVRAMEEATALAAPAFADAAARGVAEVAESAQWESRDLGTPNDAGQAESGGEHGAAAVADAEPHAIPEPNQAEASTDGAADSDTLLDAEEYRRAMERLRLGVEAPLPGPVVVEQPFEYQPRFTLPFGKPSGVESPPAAPAASAAPAAPAAPAAAAPAARSEPTSPPDAPADAESDDDGDSAGEGEGEETL